MKAPSPADLSTVSPQLSFMETCMPSPTPSSSVYLDVRQDKDADGSVRYAVTGAQVVLAKGDPNRLWETLHVDRGAQKLDPANPRNATKSVSIYCDRLDVHGELCIPEAEVTIHARELVWADRSAAINVSPLDWAVGKAADAQGTAPGRDGAHGRNAGNLNIFVSKVSPANDNDSRLLALGGRGQDPGKGRNGADGESRRSWSAFSSRNIDTGGLAVSDGSTTFDPPAIYIDFSWRWAASCIASTTEGVNTFPTDGQNALAPGRPGDAGDGGKLRTNRPELVKCLRNPGGTAGAKEQDCKGGAKGTPQKSAKYKVVFWHNFFGTKNAKVDKTNNGEYVTKDGSNGPAPAAAKAAGNSPAAEVVKEHNAWLHPLGVHCALAYMRDLFLSGARDELLALLSPYEQAFAAAPGNAHWKDEGGRALLTSVRAELASMLQKLHGRLDYFGNPAGYTPFLSLQSTTKLYKEETERALRSLLLTRWICSKDREARDSAKALAEAVALLNKDTAQAAAQVVEAEAQLRDADDRIKVIQKELSGLSNDLEALRGKLLKKAEASEDRKAKIKFAIHMASAICQVVPVGQPALGAVGSLASTASKLIDGTGGKAVPDTLSEIGKVMDKANSAMKEAKKAKEAAEKEAKDLTADQKAAKAKAGAWAQAGAGLGPAIAEVAKGLEALQVPQAAVEAELQRLEAESPEWASLTKKIREVNERKTGLLTTTISALQQVGEGYARISANGAAVVAMSQDMAKPQGKIDDHSLSFIRQMDQRSRMTLTRYVYLMVKAYQTTVLEPIDLEWKSSELTDKIINLIGPEGGFDAKSLEAHVKVLLPIYEENLNTIRRKLMEEYSFNESTFTLQMGLSESQTPLDIDHLNRTLRTVVDPLEFGLLLPDQHLARISKIRLAALEFDPDGPKMPENVNLVISVQPGNTGAMRKGERLCTLFSDYPLKWSWTCMSNGAIKASERSQAAEDILNLILGPDSEKIRQKVALPPVWSKLFIKVAYSPILSQDKRPRIRRLLFDFICDSSPAPEHQCVLTVRSVGSNGGAVVTCSKDMGGRGDGFDNMLRIYPKGATVTLSVPTVEGGASFESWDLIGSQLDWKDVRQQQVSVPLEDHVLALCNWAQADVEEGVFLLSDAVGKKDLLGLQPEEKRSPVFQTLNSAIEARENRLEDLSIYHETAENSPILGLVPDLEQAEILEQGTGDWSRVNFRGVVGWVHAAPRTNRS